MIIKHRGAVPVIDASAWVAPNAVIAGNVRIGPECRVQYGAVLSSEASNIAVGTCTIVCENALLRSTKNETDDYPTACGDYCFIGPHATILGCRVESNSYIATGVTILHGATVRSGAIVAVGALVHAKTLVPEGFFVPPHTTAIGDPVEIFAQDETNAVMDAIKSLKFAKTAFGIDTYPTDRSSTLKAITLARSEEFAAHRHDEIC